LIVKKHDLEKEPPVRRNVRILVERSFTMPLGILANLQLA